MLLAQGRLAEARAQADEVLALGVANWATLQSMTAVVLVAIESRDTELARRLLSYRPEGADHGYRPSSLQLIRGSSAVQRGDLPTALEYFMDWGRSAERADWRNPAVFPWRAWAAGLHYRMGDTRQAHELVDEEYARARAWGTPVAIGRAQRVKGALTAGERGLDLLRESLATLEESPNGMERARTGLLLGRRLLDAGRPEAETHLRQAREAALLSGAHWLADRARPGAVHPGQLHGLGRRGRTHPHRAPRRGPRRARGVEQGHSRAAGSELARGREAPDARLPEAERGRPVPARGRRPPAAGRRGRIPRPNRTEVQNLPPVTEPRGRLHRVRPPAFCNS
ncbi:hypothetical protein GCM10020000_08420 [Streptomyces olivoverticillatus]